ncbi:hypothetical protein HJG60_010793 [Phyllostomus discolor]|uniref:Uncharacterized protein n=1 Tax=Phyllostomus discolor TaxID=89673 RepID=A0A834AH97_9CHIR|nr:hypothetical protein HJG60_010793 [Phyllostomus discolor]
MAHRLVTCTQDYVFACSLHGPWGLNSHMVPGLQERACHALHPPRDYTGQCIRTPSCLEAHDLVAPAATWPMDSRSESETGSSWEHVKLPEWPLSSTCRLQRTALYNGAGTLHTGFCFGLAGDGRTLSWSYGGDGL